MQRNRAEAITAGRRLVLGASFLAGGGALLVYILTGISLAAGLLVGIVGCVACAAVAWRRSASGGRLRMAAMLHAGVVAGALATAAYDLSRFLVVSAAGIRYRPFEALNLFGAALVGTAAAPGLIRAAGIAYHVLNGVGFGVAFTLWAGRRGIWAGLAWAAALEVAMVAVYPGWLKLQALDEFLQVSAIGHAAYGSVLGLSARRLLARADAVG